MTRLNFSQNVQILVEPEVRINTAMQTAITSTSSSALVMVYKYQHNK